MAGKGWKGQWGGYAGWGEEWPAAPWKGKSTGKKGKGGKSKDWEAGEAGGGEEALQRGHTGRILSRYQFPKAVLKNAADQQGSAFVKGPKKVDDVSFLSPKHLKETLGPRNSHLVRRPRIGLSETAGSIQAGADVLQNRTALDFAAVAQALEKKEVAEALQALNTLDPSVEHTEEAVAAALATLHSELCGNAAVEEALVKVTVAASRLYLLGMNLLPLALLVCMKHPGWWTEKLPDGASDHKKVRAWRADPKDKQKMFRALAAMVQEKIAADAEYGKNDAAALFGKASAAAGSDASSESASKPKKSKKKSEKKSKKKKKSSSSSQAKHKKKNKKSASGSSEESGQTKAKKGQRAKTHKKKDKKRSSSDSRQSN